MEYLSEIQRLLESSGSHISRSGLHLIKTLLIKLFNSKDTHTIHYGEVIITLVDYVQCLIAYFCKVDSTPESLRTYIEIILDIALLPKITNTLLKTLFEHIIELVLDPSVSFHLAHEIVKLLNEILVLQNDAPKRVPIDSFNKWRVMDYLCICGDYNYQETLLEMILRLSPNMSDPEYVRNFFPDKDYLQSALMEINQGKFEIDARRFLNLINEDNGTVVSVKAISVKIGGIEILAPRDFQNLDKDTTNLWIDFNIITKRLSFHCAPLGKEDLWEFISIDNKIIDDIHVKRNKLNVDIIIIMYGQISYQLPSSRSLLKDAKKVKISLLNSEKTEKVINSVLPDIFSSDVGRLLDDRESMSMEHTLLGARSLKSVVTDSSTKSFGVKYQEALDEFQKSNAEPVLLNYLDHSVEVQVSQDSIGDKIQSRSESSSSLPSSIGKSVKTRKVLTSLNTSRNPKNIRKNKITTRLSSLLSIDEGNENTFISQNMRNSNGGYKQFKKHLIYVSSPLSPCTNEQVFTTTTKNMKKSDELEEKSKQVKERISSQETLIEYSQVHETMDVGKEREEISSKSEEENRFDDRECPILVGVDNVKPSKAKKSTKIDTASDDTKEKQLVDDCEDRERTKDESDRQINNVDGDRRKRVGKKGIFRRSKIDTEKNEPNLKNDNSHLVPTEAVVDKQIKKNLEDAEYSKLCEIHSPRVGSVASQISNKREKKVTSTQELLNVLENSNPSDIISQKLKSQRPYHTTQGEYVTDKALSEMDKENGITEELPVEKAESFIKSKPKQGKAEPNKSKSKSKLKKCDAESPTFDDDVHKTVNNTFKNETSTRLRKKQTNVMYSTENIDSNSSLSQVEVGASIHETLDGNFEVQKAVVNEITQKAPVVEINPQMKRKRGRPRKQHVENKSEKLERDKAEEENQSNASEQIVEENINTNTIAFKEQAQENLQEIRFKIEKRKRARTRIIDSDSDSNNVSSRAEIFSGKDSVVNGMNEHKAKRIESPNIQLDDDETRRDYGENAGALDALFNKVKFSQNYKSVTIRNEEKETLGDVLNKSIEYQSNSNIPGRKKTGRLNKKQLRDKNYEPPKEDPIQMEKQAKISKTNFENTSKKERTIISNSKNIEPVQKHAMEVIEQRANESEVEQPECELNYTEIGEESYQLSKKEATQVEKPKAKKRKTKFEKERNIKLKINNIEQVERHLMELVEERPNKAECESNYEEIGQIPAEESSVCKEEFSEKEKQIANSDTNVIIINNNLSRNQNLHSDTDDSIPLLSPDVAKKRALADVTNRHRNTDITETLTNKGIKNGEMQSENIASTSKVFMSRKRSHKMKIKSETHNAKKARVENDSDKLDTDLARPNITKSTASPANVEMKSKLSSKEFGRKFKSQSRKIKTFATEEDTFDSMEMKETIEEQMEEHTIPASNDSANSMRRYDKRSGAPKLRLDPEESIVQVNRSLSTDNKTKQHKITTKSLSEKKEQLNEFNDNNDANATKKITILQDIKLVGAVRKANTRRTSTVKSGRETKLHMRQELCEENNSQESDSMEDTTDGHQKIKRNVLNRAGKLNEIGTDTTSKNSAMEVNSTGTTNAGKKVSNPYERYKTMMSRKQRRECVKLSDTFKMYGTREELYMFRKMLKAVEVLNVAGLALFARKTKNDMDVTIS